MTQAIVTALKAAPKLQALYANMCEKGFDKDVPITTIYDWIYGGTLVSGREEYRQQYISSYITRFNRRLKAHRIRIVPGERKQTYRLTRV